MKNKFLLLFFLTSTFLLNAQSRYITGKLTHLDAPIAGAEISLKNTDTKVKSSVDGSYSLSANVGDIIVYSYPSLETVEIIIEDVTSILNVKMYQKVTELDEVVVKGSNRKSQQELELEYPYNPNLIRTAWGIIDSQTAAGKMRFLKDEDINDVAICILDVLRFQLSGVNVSGDCQNGGFVTIRGISSLFSRQAAIFDIDGQIFTDTPIWIIPSQMERVAVLNSLSLTNRYGSVASGGVVVINTKTGVSGIAGTKVLDRARLRNNIYRNDALGKTSFASNLPTYLQDLNNAKDLAEAKKVYEKNKSSYMSSPYYFIDAVDYFSSRGDSRFVNQIISESKYLFEDNPVHTKAVAYYLEANGDKRDANELYEEIFIMRPSYSQSYRDLAESYREVGNIKKAANMYARHNYLLDQGFLQSDSIGIHPVIERESENLLALEGDEVMNGLERGDRLAKYTEFEGTRLLFEWNDSEAEFEIQFVNPEKHYYTWKHTMKDNALRIKDEKMKGYSCEEFLVDGSLPGRWMVNINYNGNKKLSPTYMKVTTYYNYGKPSQRKEVNVYRLGLKDVNYQLFGLNNTSIVSTN